MSARGKVALLGGGLIGAGWAGRLLINGYDVAVCDLAEGVGERVRASVDNALRAYRRMTLAPVEIAGELLIVPSLEAAVEGAVYIQESLPEDLAVKCPMLERTSRLAGPDVVIASSSSGLLPSELQRVCERPERVCIGHPFVPVYLMPLVEVVGGKETSAATKERAAEFYRGIGMHPLILRKEVDAYIADRFMESVWREALHLLKEGVATAEELDQALCYGPGLRWSFMGTFLTCRLGGGHGGIRHFLKQFAPTLKLPWARFEAPEFDSELQETVARQSDEQAGDVTVEELQRMRDDCLVAVMQGLRSCDRAVGSVLREYEKRLYKASHRDEWSGEDDVSGPLRLHRARVPPEWVDYNDHLTESRYLQFFGDTTDALLWYLGVDTDYHARGYSYYTAETHIRHLREVHGGAELQAETILLDFDEKRIHLMHFMRREDDGELLATAEHMMLHVDTEQGRTCPAEPQVLAALDTIMKAHRSMERPPGAGRSIGIPRRQAGR